jgi:hypothetical protein
VVVANDLSSAPPLLPKQNKNSAHGFYSNSIVTFFRFLDLFFLSFFLKFIVLISKSWCSEYHDVVGSQINKTTNIYSFQISTIT